MKSGREHYDKSQYIDTPVPSYREHTADERCNSFQSLQGDASFDVAVIGSGYTGLSTALYLARDHQVSVCVLENGHMGWGASGRNGGFGCFPASKLDLDQLISRYGLDETRRFRSQTAACNV